MYRTKGRWTVADQRISDKAGDLIQEFLNYVFDHPELLKDDETKDQLAFAPDNDPEYARYDLEKALCAAREKEDYGVMVIRVAGDGRPGPRFSIARRIPPGEVARLADEELPVAA